MPNFSQTPRGKGPALTVGLLMLMAGTAVFAHHSGAMFDDSKALTLSGTVKAYQWSNPHCWIQLLVPGEQGATEWSIEMGSPSLLFRGGWRPATLKAGDRIIVTARPMRDGSNGGLYVSATRDDGKPIEIKASATDAGAPGSRPP